MQGERDRGEEVTYHLTSIGTMLFHPGLHRYLRIPDPGSQKMGGGVGQRVEIPSCLCICGDLQVIK